MTATAQDAGTSRDADVVIIGAGVIGSALAYELSRRGRRTLNLDALPSAGYGSTSYSSAIVRFSYSTLAGVAMAWEARHYWRDWPAYLDGAGGADLAELVHLRDGAPGHLGRSCHEGDAAVRRGRHPLRALGGQQGREAAATARRTRDGSTDRSGATTPSGPSRPSRSPAPSGCPTRATSTTRSWPPATCSTPPRRSVPGSASALRSSASSVTTSGSPG